MIVRTCCCISLQIVISTRIQAHGHSNGIYPLLAYSGITMHEYNHDAPRTQIACLHLHSYYLVD